MAVATRPRISTEEFLALPEQGPRYELECGELIEVTRASFEHNEFLGWLFGLLAAHVYPRRMGRIALDTLLVLEEATGIVYAPDLLYLASEHLDRIRHGRVYGAADLVVEILSPSTEPRDRGAKLRNYYRHEVPWYWLLHRETQTIEEYRWTPEGYLLTATVLAGETFQPGLFPSLEIRLADFPITPEATHHGVTHGLTATTPE